MVDIIFDTGIDWRLDIVKAYLISNNQSYDVIDKNSVRIFLETIEDVFGFADEVLKFVISHNRKGECSKYEISISIVNNNYCMSLIDCYDY